jgi:hypothetical protein
MDTWFLRTNNLRLVVDFCRLCFAKNIYIFSVRHRPEQNRVTWETPSSEAIPLLQEPIGVLASYVTHAQTQV